MQNHLLTVFACDIRDGGIVVERAQTSLSSLLAGEVYYPFFNQGYLKRVGSSVGGEAVASGGVVCVAVESVGGGLEQATKKLTV